MGRWAQRKRSGGGNLAPITPTLGKMVSATITGADTARVIYSVPINASEFTPTDFQSQASAALGLNMIQNDDYSVDITFDNPITGDATLGWNGTAPVLQSPDEVPYT